MDEGRARLEAVAEAVLGAVLVGSPFERRNRDPEIDGSTDDAPEPDGSGPWPAADRALHLLWCGASTRVARELPGLWRQVRQHDPATTGCIDLVVDVDVLGRLVAADIEAVELSRLLAGVGDADGAAAAAELPGLPAEVALPAVADLLERLLVAAR